MEPQVCQQPEGTEESWLVKSISDEGPGASTSWVAVTTPGDSTGWSAVGAPGTLTGWVAFFTSLWPAAPEDSLLTSNTSRLLHWWDKRSISHHHI